MIQGITCSRIAGNNKHSDVFVKQKSGNPFGKFLKFFWSFFPIRHMGLIGKKNIFFFGKQLFYLQKDGKSADTAVKKANRFVFVFNHQKKESQSPKTANTIWASKNRKTI